MRMVYSATDAYLRIYGSLKKSPRKKRPLPGSPITHHLDYLFMRFYVFVQKIRRYESVVAKLCSMKRK